MFDTATVTIAGNVVADPRVTGLPDDPDRVKFRVVSTRRRRDPQTGTWVDAGEYAVNVVCWRNLARGVARSLRRGDPVLVIGRIGQREYTGDDGARHWFTEVTADFVGHDLAKGASQQFYRFSRLSRLDDQQGPDGQGAVGTAPAAAADLATGTVRFGAVDENGGDDLSVFDDDPEELPEPELSGV